jgi:uncharacterized membrane protein YbhN (UPF0104 family)
MRGMTRRSSRKHVRYLADLVRAAFPGEAGKDWGKEYLGYVRERLSASLARLRRSLTLSAVLVVLFFALGAGEIKEITFSGVKLKDFGPVAKLVPAYVAYLTYDTTYLILEVSELRAMLDAATKVLLPRISHRGLDYVLDFANPAVLGGLGMFATRPEDEWRSRWETMLFGLTAIVLVMLMLVVPLAFLVYAFVHLFKTYGTADALLWISLALVMASVLRIIALLALRVQLAATESRWLDEQRSSGSNAEELETSPASHGRQNPR